MVLFEAGGRAEGRAELGLVDVSDLVADLLVREGVSDKKVGIDSVDIGSNKGIAGCVRISIVLRTETGRVGPVAVVGTRGNVALKASE